MNEKQKVLLDRAGALRQQIFEELQKRLTPEDLGLVQQWELLWLYSALLGGITPGPNWDERQGWEEMGEMLGLLEVLRELSSNPPPSADGSEAPGVDGAGGTVD